MNTNARITSARPKKVGACAQLLKLQSPPSCLASFGQGSKTETNLFLSIRLFVPKVRKTLQLRGTKLNLAQSSRRPPQCRNLNLKNDATTIKSLADHTLQTPGISRNWQEPTEQSSTQQGRCRSTSRPSKVNNIDATKMIDVRA